MNTTELALELDRRLHDETELRAFCADPRMAELRQIPFAIRQAEYQRLILEVREDE